MMGRYEAEDTPGWFKSLIAIFYSAEYRKFQAVLIGVLLAAATQGLLPAAIATWTLLVVGVLTAAGVYVVPNNPQKLILQPAGTAPRAPDVVVEVATETADTDSYRGDVRG